MRRLLTRSFVVAALLSSASAGHAGSLTSATLAFAVGTLPAVSFSSTAITGGGNASGTGAGAVWSVAAGAVPGGVLTTTLPATAAPPLSALKVVVNGNPVLGGFAASSGGAMPVTGTVHLKVSALTVLKVPVTIGVPGTLIPPPAGGIGVTAFANDWTTKTTSIAVAATPSLITLMGANGLVGGAGTVVLVTALDAFSNVTGQLPTFGILTLNYAAPEPALAAPLAGVAAGLIALGRRRMRR